MHQIAYIVFYHFIYCVYTTPMELLREQNNNTDWGRLGEQSLTIATTTTK